MKFTENFADCCTLLFNLKILTTYNQGNNL